MNREIRLSKLRDAAVEAAHASGKILMKYYERPLNVREKKGAGLVTQADLESEEKCVKILKKRFPEFGFLTEENDPQAGTSPGRWVIDPLDGTTNFVHRFPMFSVSIAAQWDNETVVGVVYHPVLDETWLAIRGKGTTRNKKPVHVSQTKKLTDSLLTTGFSYRAAVRASTTDQLHMEMHAFERLSRIARAVRRPGSAALDLAYVSCGIFDGFWERNLSPWDTAAGYLLVQEAGGIVTDFQGNPFQIESKQILASNSNLHATLRQTIAPEFCLL